MFAAPGRARPHYQRLLQRFTELTEGEFDRKRDLAALTLLRQGVTFTVYSDAQGTERIFPFDLIPRIISGKEWKKIERGLEQRITALNLFLHDIYHGQSILRDGVIPKDYVCQAAHFRPEFMHFNVPQNIYVHICGTDLVRDRDGNFLVLEDNARCPSGVSQICSRNTVSGQWKIIARSSSMFCVTSRPRGKRIPPSCSLRPASTTPLITSIRFSRAQWESKLSRAGILLRAMGKFSCARPKACSRSTLFIAGLMTIFSIRRFFGKIPDLAFPDWSMPIATETSVWPIPSAPASRTTKSSITLCRK